MNKYARASLRATALLLSGAVHADEVYRFERALKLPEHPQAALAGVTLDSALYEHTRNGFADLRLVDNSGAERPYWLQRVSSVHPVSQRDWRSVQILSQQHTGDAWQWRVRLPDTLKGADGLHFAGSNGAFDYRVSVAGSRDGKHWTPLLQDAALYDYAPALAVSQRDLTLPPNTYRQLQIRAVAADPARRSAWQTWVQPLGGATTELNAAPPNWERINAWRNELTPQPRLDNADYALTDVQLQPARADQPQALYLHSRREPLTALTVQGDRGEFSHAVRIQVPSADQADVWQDIAAGVLQHLDFPGVQRDQRLFNFVEQRQSLYRIVWDHPQAPAWNVGAVQAHGLVYRLLFMAEPSQQYRLRYGAAQVLAARYDNSDLRTAYAANPPLLVADLQPEIDHAVAPPVIAAPTPAMDDSTPVAWFWLTGTLAALLIGALVWAKSRKNRSV